MTSSNEHPARALEHAEDHAVLSRCLFTEMIGAFVLVSVDCGGAMIGKLAPQEVTAPARAAAAGLVVMAMIYAMGNVSGAHFNPAVTFAFALRGVFPRKRVLHYWSAQLAGALTAAGFLRLLIGNVDHVGATLPHFGTGRAFAIEVFLTFLLVSIILGTATRHRSVGANAAIASGAAVAVCCLFSRPLSGASMNPARSLAPALVSGELGDVWIYLTAPFLGAALAHAVMRVIHAHRHDSERDAAQGKEREDKSA